MTLICWFEGPPRWMGIRLHTVVMPTIAGIAAFGFLLMGQVGMALGCAAFVLLWFGIEALIGDAVEARRKRDDDKGPR